MPDQTFLLDLRNSHHIQIKSIHMLVLIDHMRELVLPRQVGHPQGEMRIIIIIQIQHDMIYIMLYFPRKIHHRPKLPGLRLESVNWANR